MPPTNVSWQRSEIRSLMSIYFMIRDVLTGTPAIKGFMSLNEQLTVSYTQWHTQQRVPNYTAAKRYLPQPNPADTSQANAERYANYLARAMWYGFTARTLDGLVGQVFQRDPDITLPDEMKLLLDDIDGAGVSATQQMKRCVEYAIGYGRSGLLADYPSFPEGLTADKAQLRENLPDIQLYAPWQIINWRVKKTGAQKLITLLVLYDENVFDDTDGFELFPVAQYRVYRLTTDGVTLEFWQDGRAGDQRSVAAKAGDFKVTTTAYLLKDGSGKALKQIPFKFVGAKNNDDIPDKPPIQDMAELNIAHYRNSADYEDASHLLGQPTPYASGLTQQWIDGVWGGNAQIPLGSRALIPLPVQAEIGILQVEPNTMVRQAMLDKEEQAIKLGAKLIESGSTTGTATEALIDETSETSVLSNAASNVAAAYTDILRFAAAFMGITVAIGPKKQQAGADDNAQDPNTVLVKLNTSFQFTRMTAGDRQELIAEWVRGAISFTEMRDGLRAAGVATQSDKDAKEEIKQELEAALATGFSFGPPIPGGVPGSAGGAGGGIPGGPAGPQKTPPGQAPNPKPPATGSPNA